MRIQHLMGVVVCMFIATASFSQVCTGDLTVTIEGSSSGEALSVTCEGTAPLCNVGSGDLSGMVDVTVTGGTPDFTYVWDGPITTPGTEDQSDLGTGTYSVTVTDSNNCTGECSVMLEEPTPVEIAGSTGAPACNAGNGGLTGTIDITPSGGTAPYTYAWTGPGVDATAQNQTGLGTGTYTVVVTDANDCTATETFDLTEPEPIAIADDVMQPTCNDANGPLTGAIDLTITGGTAPYTFAWSDGSTATTEDLADLGTGTYTVVVTDANNCTETATFTLQEPEPIDIAADLMQPTCPSANGALTGEIDLTVTGGTAPYTYAWTGPGVVASAEDQTGLGTGSYTVVVTDDNNCTETMTYSLTEPDGMDIAESLGQPTCNTASGDLTGTIDIVVSGGTAPYTYAWTGPGVDATAQNQTGLGTGTYTVVVTDANDCTYTETYDLTEPQPVAIADDVMQPTCNDANGALTGAIDITVTGGTAPYTYAWTGPGVAASAEDQSGLGTGTYTVVVTDANNCTETATFTLTEPDPIVIADDVMQPTCPSANGALTGAIDITVTGGTAPYTYAWTGPGVAASAEDQTGLGSGQYVVVVTDANNCTETMTYDLTEPEGMDIAETLAEPLCNAGSGNLSGTIDIVVSGGTAPYTYAWTGPGVDATAQNQSGLGTGTYTVVVTDANDCTYTETYDLTEPQPVAVAADLGAPTCNAGNGGLTGTIDITASGGTAPYTYAWTGPGVDATAEDQSGLGEGTYCVTITDANDCTVEECYDLTEPEPLDIVETLGQPLCNASNTDQVNGTIDIVVTGGTAPYTYAWTSLGSPVVAGDQNQVNLGSGLYTVVVTDANNCTYTETYTLEEPPIINILAVAVDLTCHFDSYDPDGTPSSPDGSITLQVTGGTPGYTFNWDGPGVDPTAQNQTDLIAGTYNVTVTDANNCVWEASYDLTQPDPVTVVGDVTPLLCHADSGLPSGEIDITPGGGVGTTNTDYTYEWEASAGGSGINPTAEDQTGLSAGTYTVTVTDPSGCIVVETWTLTEPEAVECSLAATEILCNGDLSTITVTADGGAGVTEGYTYILNGMTAGTTVDADGNLIPPAVVGPFTMTHPNNTFQVEAGTYTVTTIDANGCESECTISMDQPTQLVAGTCVVQDECQLNAGEIQVCAEEGVGPYIVTWTSSTGGTLNETTLTIATSGDCVTFTGAQGGETYEFIVTDDNGCQVP
jgi:hypothetical protein